MASSSTISWQINRETVADFILGGSKITADGDCSHEIKRRLLLGRKVKTNLDSILKNRDITLPTKVHLVKAMVFPVVARNNCPRVLQGLGQGAPSRGGGGHQDRAGAKEGGVGCPGFFPAHPVGNQMLLPGHQGLSHPPGVSGGSLRPLASGPGSRYPWERLT